MILLTTQNCYLKAISEINLKELVQFTEIIEITKTHNIQFPPGLYFPLSCVLAVERGFANGEMTLKRFVGGDGIIDIREDATSNEMPISVVKPGLIVKKHRSRSAGSMYGNSRCSLAAMRIYRARSEQYSVNASCSASHSITKQVARILLRARNAFRADQDLCLSHEEISRFLGVRRETVTETLAAFAKRGVIEKQRGKVNILDLHALRSLSCDCIDDESALESQILEAIRDIWKSFEEERPDIPPPNISIDEIKLISRAGGG